MKRINIVGSTGSGKSVLAAKLAERLGLVYTDLDDLHHLPGWKERPEEDFRRLVDEATRQEKWVIAGNYSKARDITWARADTVIWIDLPLGYNFWQLLKRTFKRAYTGEMICNGNRETLGKQFFTPDSILWWLLKTWYKNRKKYGEIFDDPGDYPHITFVRLKSHRQGQAFLESL